MKPTEYTLKETRIRRCAYPLMFQGGSRAVLGLHGYMGYPGELYYPAEKLNEAGFTVSVPRLPGHGSSGCDFNQSSSEEWIRSALDSYIELASSFDDVFIMGHSMGGLLALLTASVFPVKKIALMAPAVSLRQPLILTEVAQIFINKSLNRPLWKADPTIHFKDIREEGDDVYLGQEYWTWSYFRRLADLSRLRRKTVHRLPEVKGQILTILGGHDKIVHENTSSIIEKRAGGPVTTVTLEESAHLLPYEKEFEKNGNLLLDWFV